MKRNNKSTVIIYGILCAGLVVAMYPFFYMCMNSLKNGTEIANYPYQLPKQPSLKAYIKIFTQLNMFRLFVNTAFIAASTAFASCFFNSMVAYALEKIHFTWNNLVFKIILSTMMIPPILLLIPTYIFMYNIGWVNTYRVLIIPAIISPFNIFLVKQYYKHIDNAYIEAAIVDGASHWHVFRSIVLPMSKPVLSTVGVLVFLNSWNDFFGPLLYLRDEAKYTLQLGIFKLYSEIPNQNLEQIWAALVVSTIPVLLIYLCLQESFIRSFVEQSLK
jgi:multiple sugar transport system permease protein